MSETRSSLSVLVEKNLAVLIISIAAFGILMLTISVPFLQDIISFEYPGYKHFIPAFIGAFGMLFVLETIKVLRKKARA